VVLIVPRAETGRGGVAWRAGAGRCGGGAAPIDVASLTRARGWSVGLYRANRFHVLPVLVLPRRAAIVGAGAGIAAASWMAGVELAAWGAWVASWSRDVLILGANRYRSVCKKQAGCKDASSLLCLIFKTGFPVISCRISCFPFSITFIVL